MFLGMFLIFHHARFEVNVTSPNHRLQNPNNPKAALFSRLHLMENFRLINDRLCLYTEMLDSSDGMWWFNSGHPINDPFVTAIPSTGYHENITHVKVYSCTSVE